MKPDRLKNKVQRHVCSPPPGAAVCPLKPALLLMLLTVCLHLAPGIAFARTSTAVIPTRPGVTLDILVMRPDHDPGKHEVLILFAGGNGAMPFRLTDDGSVYGWNFLVRSADRFIRQGLSIVVVSPPSDHATGMNIAFRESREHADDIAALIAHLDKLGFSRVFLVGNSRGTISAAALAARIKDSRIRGVILTSTLDYDNFMNDIPLEQIRVPVLMVHHREDICQVSPLPEALRTMKQLKNAASVDFVEVDGGAFYARSAPCDNLSAHGFFGIEDKVVRLIADWVSGRKVPARID